MKNLSDMLIIGGGVIGCALAESLAREGLSVTLLERGLIGREASWAAAGMLAPQSEMEAPGAYLDFCLASRRLYPETVARLCAETAIDPQYRSEGMLYAALTSGDEATLLDRAAWQQALGLGLEVLTAEAALKREPALTPRLRMAVHFQEDHQLDPRLLTQGYAVAARQAGARLLEYRPVGTILRENGRAIGVESGGDRFYAASTVVAAGAWSGLLKGLVPEIPVYPVKGEVLLLQAATPPFRHTLHTPSVYLVPRLDGRIVVGATEKHGAGYDKTVGADAVGQLLARAREAAPLLEAADFMDAWAGLRPGTLDRRPILGPSAMPGLVYCTGHFRNGVLLAPLTARLMTQYLVGGSLPAELLPFGPDRFDSFSTTSDSVTG
jgi:glycine oxidase